jgi:hypothetical protein
MTFFLLRLLTVFALLVTGAQASPQAEPGSLPAKHASQLSVSGLSSGGYMAVQFEIAYSGSVVGAGIIAGGPYFCARGNVGTATSVCSCTSGTPWCGVTPGGTRVNQLAELTKQNASNDAIDATANLTNHRVWLFSGRSDTLVPTPVMNDLRDYYGRFVPAENISYRTHASAEHAIPTDFFGNHCSTLAPPYINHCALDGAGELLGWIYGALNPRQGNTAQGRFIEFGQEEFLDEPRGHGMAATGYLYVPPGCEGDAQGCKLHVAFHGCKQTVALVGDAHIRNAGYNSWADANRILVLYPQAAPTWMNPNSCWDWWGYDDRSYAERSGRQMQAVKRMTERLTGGP